jgi:hypothetical protein
MVLNQTSVEVVLQKFLHTLSQIRNCVLPVEL